MRHFCFFGMALFLFAAAARAEEAAEQPYLVLNSGGHTGPISQVLFTYDGKEVLTVSSDKTVRRWDAATGERLGVCYLPAGPGAEGMLRAGALAIRRAPVLCVAWSDDDTLATGEASSAGVSLWDRRGKLLRHFDEPPGNPETVLSLTLLPGKQKLLYMYRNSADEHRGEVFRFGGGVLDLAAPEGSHAGYSWERHLAENFAAVSPNGLLAAATDGDGVILWTLKDGKRVRRLAGRRQTPYAAGCDPNGRVVGWGGGFAKEGLQRSFDLGGLSFGKKPNAGFVRAAHKEKSEKFGELRVETPPDGYAVNVVKRKGKGDVLATIKTEYRPGARCYTFLPGDRLALGSYDYVKVYDAATGKLLHTLGGASGTNIWDLAPSPDGRYLLGAFSDQTLRVWDPDKGEPLLSLFTAGADWVAWTEKGYYAASPAGERLMGWQVNHGLEQLGTFYAAAEFHKAFYRPDVISRVLAEGSVAKALEAADKANGTATRTVDVAQALPPEASLLSPSAGKLDKAEVEVKAQAVSKDRPVLSLRLLLDGRPCPGADVKSFPGAKAGDKQEASWSVTLPEGEHTLAARAESDVSAAASPEVAVAWQAAAQEPLPTLYVLAVGVNAYPGSLKLNWAVDDATAVARAFQAEAAPKPYGKVETKLLLDKDATKDGILAGLDWLKERMAAGGDDTAVVFYAGHGHRDKKTGQFYMLPQDVDVSDLAKTGVTGTQLKEKLQAAPGRVLVLLDACHSGSIGQSPPDPGSLTDDVQRQLAAPDCGVVVMCAAMAQEEAGEAAAFKHGFFTAALLSGLGGGAPASRDGLVHLTALNFYVEEEVAELSKDEQHVVVDRPSTVTSFPLVSPPKKPEGEVKMGP